MGDLIVSEPEKRAIFRRERANGVRVIDTLQCQTEKRPLQRGELSSGGTPSSVIGHGEPELTTTRIIN